MTLEKVIEIIENDVPTRGYLSIKEALDMTVSALKEVQQYREIGTVEECREAAEKQKKKTPIKSDLDIEESVIKFYECPNCGDILCDMPGNRDKYCRECGQAIHWSDE